jgi:hypothetical protein
MNRQPTSLIEVGWGASSIFGVTKDNFAPPTALVLGIHVTGHNRPTRHNLLSKTTDSVPKASSLYKILVDHLLANNMTIYLFRKLQTFQKHIFQLEIEISSMCVDNHVILT